MGESNSLQDGAEYDRRGNRKKYQKPGYNLDRRTYEVDDGSDRLEQQLPLKCHSHATYQLHQLLLNPIQSPVIGSDIVYG